MEEERDYRKILNDSKVIAFNSLKNFFKNIELNSNLFSHVFETPIKIDYTEDITEGECAVYNPNDGKFDAIYIGIDYLDSMFNHIENGANYSAAVVDIANTIVHECIHKLRIITLKEEVSLNNISESITKNTEMYHNLNKKLNEYDDILVLSTFNNKKNMSRYIPIKVYIYKQNYYTFIAYNKKTKSYEIFEKKVFNTKYKNNYESFMENLAWEVSINHKIISTESYKSPLMSNSDTIVYNAMDLYTIPIEYKYNTYKKKQEILNKLDEIRKSIKGQIYLEEAFTEVLSNMIILSRNSNYFDIKELSTKIFNKTNSLNEKCALHLITSGGLSLIKSFILAPYGDEFRNVFNEYYEEDYPKLLAKFKELGDEENNYILSNEIIGMTELRRKK